MVDRAGSKVSRGSLLGKHPTERCRRARCGRNMIPNHPERSVRPQYPTELAGKVMYELDTGTGPLGKSGKTSNSGTRRLGKGIIPSIGGIDPTGLVRYGRYILPYGFCLRITRVVVGCPGLGCYFVPGPGRFWCVCLSIFWVSLRSS